MAFRKGDTVSLKGIVKFDVDAGDTQVAVDLEGYYQTIWMAHQDATLIQAAFDVGDDVEWPQDDGTNAGTILAISNGHAWIDLNNGDYCTRMLTSIWRAGHFNG